MLAIIAVPAGLLIGLSLGALGGGSILTVPALVYLLRQQPHTTTTGSLLIVGITALAGTAAYRRAGSARPRELLSPVIGGSGYQRACVGVGRSGGPSGRLAKP